MEHSGHNVFAIRRQSFQFAERIFNEMPTFIQRFVERKAAFLVFRRYADRHPPRFQRLPQQPGRIIPSVCQKDAVFGKKVLENGRSLVIADLSFGQQKQDGPPVAVISGMKFGIQSSFCATDETWRIPFLSRIAAVR